MTNKKGMGVGEVFVYIVAALTFALIMIFGYKAINDFLVSGEEVEFVQFKNSLESSISKIYTEYGAVRIQNFYVPGKYDQVCFVDFNVLYTDDAGRELCAKDIVACNMWKDISNEEPTLDRSNFDKVDANVFLKPLNPQAPRIKVSAITMGNEGYLCLPIINGKFTLQLEGRGDHTEISPGIAE